LKKGQSSTEFLVLVGVGLTVALVSLSLLGWFPGSSVESRVSESRVYWLSASPLSVSLVKATSFGARVSLVNKGLDFVNLSQVFFGDKQVNAGFASVSGGQEVSLGLNFSCEGSGLVEVPVSFVFGKGGLTGLKQVGQKPLVFKCSGSCVLPRNGLVGYWRFNEGSGNLISDDSGSGNAGALINGPAWTVGKSGYGLQFNGVDQFVNVSYSPALQPSSITMVAWAKASSVPSTMSGIVSNKLAPYDGINLRMGSSSINLSSSVGNGTSSGIGYLFVNTNQTTQVNVWFHLAVTHDASDDSNKIYVNGDLKNQQQFKLAYAANAAAIIGNAATSISYFFNGTIDEVAIWNRVLSAQEIQAVYNCGS
jgi:hypothetical protein